jgi:hypothetical protein
MSLDPTQAITRRQLLATAAAAITGLVLLFDSAWRTGTTYDEVTYLEVAARWWRTGDQDAITRMGSPLTFWKLQQVPALFVLDWLGQGDVIDNPIPHRTWLVPVLRASSAWIWLTTFFMATCLAQLVYGPRAAVFAGWLFALGPNLLAHGALLTMEMPVTACVAACCLAFCQFLRTGSQSWFMLSALAAGLGFSCKFTMAGVVLLLGLLWGVDRVRAGEAGWRASRDLLKRGMLFVGVMLLTDFAITGFALAPISQHVGDHPAIRAQLGSTAGRWAGQMAEWPWPRDCVGFLTQLRHQANGGPSYLLGERSMNGWWYYYLVVIAVKVPLGLGLILLCRIGQISQRLPRGPEFLIAALPLAFLVLASLGSKRNYGIRYLLPVAPLAIVWLSSAAQGGRLARSFAWLGVAAVGVAAVSAGPHHLSYFNELAGGTWGGRFVLADSNLDWGQGPPSLARLQASNPPMRDSTLYQFGLADPADYGVAGRVHMVDAGDVNAALPLTLTAETRFLAVSASLQWGPWGPPPGYFRALERETPVAVTDDGTIAVYAWPIRRATREPRRDP